MSELEPSDGRQPEASAAHDGALSTDSRFGIIHCMTIIGQIEGHVALPNQTKTTKYEHMIPQLAAVEESREIEGLLLLLNTVGGDVEAGLAIAEVIAGMTKPTASVVLGGGHSIGVPLAVAASHSLIVPSATMTIHPVRFNGMVIGVPQTYRHFERIQDRIVDFVTSHSRIPAQQLRQFMLNTGELANDVGSVLTGAQAVDCGLIDRLGSLSDALAWLHGEIDRRRAAGMHNPEPAGNTTDGGNAGNES